MARQGTRWWFEQWLDRQHRVDYTALTANAVRTNRSAGSAMTMTPAARVFLLVSLAAAGQLLAQTPATLLASSGGRFVDFHRDLARSDVLVVVGTLGKGKEGKREKMADGQLGGAGKVAVVSGTQFFKVPVQAPVQPRATFAGKADKPVIGYDVQVARLPDGKEQRQSTTGNAAPMDEGMLALFVLAPRDKGKGLGLLHVIPFDKNIDKGPDGEAVFVDTMRDYHAINRRMLDLESALAKVEKAPDAAAKDEAMKELKELVDRSLELRLAQNDGLRTQHVGPLEARAKKRLAEAPPKPAAEK